MQTKYPQLKVKERKVSGRKVKLLRNEGILPANLYGKGVKSDSLQIAYKEFALVYKEVGETGIVEVLVEGSKKNHPVLIQNVQKNPVNGNFLHADFRQVNMTEKLSATVPLEMLGEAPGVKTGGVLVQILSEIEVEALPADLPDQITFDVSTLAEIGQFLTIENLIFDKSKVTLKIDDPKALIAKVEEPQKEEAPEPSPAEVAAAQEGTETEKTDGQPKEAAKPEEKAQVDKKPEEKK